MGLRKGEKRTWYVKPWNKGLTKNTDIRLKKIGKKISSNKKRNEKLSIIKKQQYKNGLKNPFKGKKHTKETKRKIGKKSIERKAFKGKNNPWFGSERFGELNPMWNGGLSFKPYTKEFNNKLKKLIKERDNNKCFLCNAKIDLCIHHIDYEKKNCNPENLITLCRGCNSKVNVKRKYWVKYFKDKLK
jgi:hypothetical protein